MQVVYDKNIKIQFNFIHNFIHTHTGILVKVKYLNKRRKRKPKKILTTCAKIRLL